MAFPLALLLPVFAPVVADGVRALFNRVTKGAGIQPANTEEAINFMKAEAEYAKSMAALDQPAANISRWVADLRASFRYIAAGLFIVSPYLLLLASNTGAVIPTEFIEMSFQGRDGAFSFIFGDRMYAYLRRK